MSDTMQDLKEKYFDWLRDSSHYENISDNIQRVSLPFLDRKNDFTEIYIVKQSNGIYRLTDDGYVINDLNFSGFVFTPKRKEVLTRILLSFGVKLNDSNEIFTTATEDDLIIKKHMLINCLIKVSDLFNLKSDTVKSLFSEDVQALFDKYNIPYIENVTFSGRSQLNYQFDFAIPKTSKSPERIIKTINSIDISTAKHLIFTWEDIKLIRNPDSIFIPIINNDTKSISSNVLTCLKEYEINPISWANIQNDIDRLIA